DRTPKGDRTTTETPKGTERPNRLTKGRTCTLIGCLEQQLKGNTDSILEFVVVVDCQVNRKERCVNVDHRRENA
ncbi:hypothetical protein KI387_028195, partial [Taxus chinensis]